MAKKKVLQKHPPVTSEAPRNRLKLTEDQLNELDDICHAVDALWRTMDDFSTISAGGLTARDWANLLDPIRKELFRFQAGEV